MAELSTHSPLDHPRHGGCTFFRRCISRATLSNERDDVSSPIRWHYGLIGFALIVVAPFGRGSIRSRAQRLNE